MGKLYDCIIIGSGPAGLTAAIYAARACLSVLVLEKEFVSGGQVVNTYEVDNYPGYRGISGFDLGMKFREHAEKLDVEFVMEAVERVDLEKEEKIIYTDQSEYHGRTVILAMGASHRKLEVRGEEDFSGMGVSYCATCDGAFFKGKTVAVVGGGDVAIEDAIFLSRGCEKVYQKKSTPWSGEFAERTFRETQYRSDLGLRGDADLRRGPGGKRPSEKYRER